MNISQMTESYLQNRIEQGLISSLPTVGSANKIVAANSNSLIYPPATTSNTANYTALSQTPQNIYTSDYSMLQGLGNNSNNLAIIKMLQGMNAPTYNSALYQNMQKVVDMQTENLKMLKDLGNNSSLSTIQFEGDTAQKFLKNTADIQSGYTEIFKSLIQTYTTGAANQSFQNFLGSNTNYYTPTNYFQTYQQQNNATNLNAQMSLLAYQMQMGMQYNQNSNLYSSTNDLTNLFSMFG